MADFARASARHWWWLGWLALMLLVGYSLAAEVSANGEDGYKINVRNADLSQFITQIAGLTGKTFVIDPRVRGNVTVISDTSMNERDIYQLMLSVLRVNGFTAVPAGEVIKIVPQLYGKQTGDGRDSGTNLLDGGERILTRVIRVDNIQPSAVVPIIRPLIPDYSHVATVPDSNLLIINDHQNNLERLERLIREMDLVEENVVEVVELKEAGVDTLLTLLQRLAPDILGDDSNQIRRVRVIANDQNNTLLLRGKRSAVQQIAKLAAQLDQSINASSGSATYWLAHADAESIAELVSNLMQDTGTKDGGSNFSIQADTSLNAVIVRADPIHMSSIKSLIKSLDIRRTQVLIEAAIVEVTLRDDLDVGGAFVVGGGSGTSTTPLISTVNQGSSGSSALGNLLGGLLGGAAATDGISQAAVLAAAGAAASPVVGAFKIATKGFSFAGLVQALSQNRNAHLLSTPSILTLDNEEAEIVVGQTVPFRTGSYNTSDNRLDPFVLIERQDIGLTLKVTPKINDDGVVQLRVFQEISNISEQQAIGPSSASDLITNKRTISTTVLADDKQTIVLGGLIQNDLRKTRVKVPFFGDIPLIGLLFRHDSVHKERRNLLVFLRPTILKTPEDVTKVTANKYSGLREVLLESRLAGLKKKQLRKAISAEAESLKDGVSEELYTPFYEGEFTPKLEPVQKP